MRGDETRTAHHSKGPEERVVQPLPALFSEPDRGLALQAAAAGHGAEDPVDGDGADRGECDGGAGDEINVIPPLDVDALRRLVVRQFEKWRGVWAERWVQVVDGQQHGQGGQGNAYRSANGQHVAFASITAEGD